MKAWVGIPTMWWTWSLGSSTFSIFLSIAERPIWITLESRFMRQRKFWCTTCSRYDSPWTSSPCSTSRPWSGQMPISFSTYWVCSRRCASCARRTWFGSPGSRRVRRRAWVVATFSSYWSYTCISWPASFSRSVWVRTNHQLIGSRHLTTCSYATIVKVNLGLRMRQEAVKSATCLTS